MGYATSTQAVPGNRARDIKESNELAQKTELWRKLYGKFLDGEFTLDFVTDLSIQALGIDRIIRMADTEKVIFAEEKVRRPRRSDGKPWLDIALEYKKRFTTGPRAGEEIPSWMDKMSKAHVLVYTFLPDLEKAYYLPWEPLRGVWKLKREEWLADESRLHRTLPDAERDGNPISYSVSVTPNELYALMAEFMGAYTINERPERVPYSLGERS